MLTLPSQFPIFGELMVACDSPSVVESFVALFVFDLFPRLVFSSQAQATIFCLSLSSKLGLHVYIYITIPGIYGIFSHIKTQVHIKYFFHLTIYSEYLFPEYLHLWYVERHRILFKNLQQLIVQICKCIQISTHINSNDTQNDTRCIFPCKLLHFVAFNSLGIFIEVELLN